MWSSKAIRSSGGDSASTHAGVAPCQTRAWPFTRMPRDSANATMRSPPEKS